MYITVDLKVIEGLASAVARAGALSEDAALAGLVRLWHRCWADEIDTMSSDEIAGCFAFDVSRPDGLSRAIAALTAFGFLEALPDLTWRVRGAARYLRLKESRRRGAAATNAVRAEKSRSRATHNDALERSGATHNDALSPSHRVTESPIGKDKPPRAKKPREPGDPRHAPMLKRLTDAFEHQTGAPYPFASSPGRNAKAVTDLLALADDATLDATWRKALMASGYPTVRTLWEFVANFAHFVGTPAKTGLHVAEGPRIYPEGKITL